jgi:putative DNA primase/helicase
MSNVYDFPHKKKPGAAWERDLLRSGEGGPLKKLEHNVILILSRAPEWAGCIAWDEFAERIVIVKACPAGPPGHWLDLCDRRTAAWLQASRWKLEASPALVANAIPVVAAQNSIHPLRARLSALAWDGKERLDTWTTTYLRAADTEVHREIGKRWMLGAVRRANKDAAMQLHGAWIVELSELDAMSRAETSKVKAFLTRRSDRYRAPYGRHVAEHPRQCVFAGTVNHNDYLRDESGGRRFLPIQVGKVKKAALSADVEQLWAEAVVRYRAGECTYTTDSRLSALIASHTSERYQGDAWHDIVIMHAQLFESISVADCLTHVGIERGRWSQSDQNRVAKILKSEGFRRRQVAQNGKREWRYFKPAQAVQPLENNASGGDPSARDHTHITTPPVTPTINEELIEGTPKGFREVPVAPVHSGDDDFDPWEGLDIEPSGDV